MPPGLAVALLSVLSVSADAQVLDDFKSHVDYLASDELRGRGTGSDDIRRAAWWTVIAICRASVLVGNSKPGGITPMMV